MRKFYAFLLSAIAFTGLLTHEAAAQNYVLTTSNGNAIVPGTTLVPGSQADDATVLITLPFTYQAYGANYTQARLSTNGNIQFTTASTTFSNVCPLPSAAQGVAFMPHWDDLNMSAGGALGIYTSVSGTAPNRIFNIEWRARRFGGTQPVEFEARLYEGQQRVDFIYGNTDLNGSSASIGVQAPPTLQTTYSCNAANLSPGLQLTFILTSCTGVPSPGFITGPAGTICAGSSATLNVNGNTTGSGITYQWRSSATPGGPYTAIPGATNPSYTFTAAATAYYICTVSCTSSGLAANTTEFAVNVSNPAHSNVVTNITNNCSPGSFTVSGTASGGSGNYTHTLTGPGGTIGAPVVSGPNNSNVSFTVTNVPAGTHVFTLRSTDAIGCFVNTPVNVVINPTPTITVTPPTATICNGAIQMITATAGGVGGSTQTFTATGAISIPSSGPGNPYPSALNVSGLPTTGVSVASVTINGINHTWPDDLDIVLVSPTGQPVILMSDCGGSTDLTGQSYTFSDAAASLLADGSLNPTGSYRPTNYLTPDAFAAPGPGSLSQATPTIASFTGNMNGTWSLFVVDDLGGDLGNITGPWSITFNLPPPVLPVTFSPTTSLFTDAAATVPYTGTAVNTVYARPSANITYTASVTASGCTATATSVITVNQPPAITAQPTALAAPVCPGFNVNYSVSATGTGLTYQWQISTDNGTTWTNIADGPQYSGTTTAALTIINVPTSLNNARYRCVVSGTCAPSVNSNSVTLVVSTAPTITTQPANATVCEGLNTSFTVVAAGVPAPTIFQWQVSTNAGVTWTNVPVFSPTLTITNAAVSQNGNRYRVIITNICGQSVTSNGSATLTVNARPAVSINPLPSRICISDTLVPLTGIPTGGFFTGVGVSGFNFVPPATAIGTYPLTYTFTNAAGCTNTASVVARVEECAERVRLLRDNAVVLFPNPNTGRFNIRINSVLYNYLGMNVYNTSGQLVKQQTWGGLVFGRVLPIDLTFLPGGVYMVKFFYDDGVRTSEKTFPVIIGRNN